MADSRELNIIDEGDNVIGTATRDEIHNKGLLHREVHVWFYTSEGKIIFQKRSKNKETSPGLLDATVGGHVEPGDSYEQTALKEAKEETGINIFLGDLLLIDKIRACVTDRGMGKINNAFRAIYAYRFDGKIGDLLIEESKSSGFEMWDLKHLLNLSEDEKYRFDKATLGETAERIFSKIKNLI